jgi:hypothetical protein
LKSATSKLGPVVSYDSVRDPKPADDRFDELDCRLLVDLDYRDCFWPLSQFVDGDVEVLVPSNGPGEWSQDGQPPHGEWP